MAIQFSNLASTTLASGVSSSATSVSVTSASLFPSLGGSDYFYATLGVGSGSEIVKVTAISGTTFTVIRGQDGTTAVSHSAGVDCALRVTAASLEDLRDATDNDTTYTAGTGVSLTGTELSLTDTNAKLNLSGGALTGAVTTTSTIDGRDLSVDGTKLDTIDTSANNYSHPSAHTISFITGLQTALDGKVDDSQVLTDVPSGALFTDTNTTYTSSDFNHDALTGFVANEHINWTGASAGTIHLTNLPATAITSVQTAVSQVAMLALTTEEGDVVVRSDESKTYMHNGGTAGTMADFTLLATPTDAVASVDGATGVITLNHDNLTGFVADEHIDWTSDQGSTNIHTGNYTNTTYTGGTGITLSGTTFNLTDTAAKLSLTGGTLSGGLSGTTGSFSGNVSGDRFILPSTASAANQWIYTDNTNTGTGSLTIQSGGGSSGYGGGLVLYSHSHASFAGWIKAGISVGSGGKFSVNSQGTGGGTDVFTVDASGNTVANGSVTAAGLTVGNSNIGSNSSHLANLTINNNAHIGTSYNSSAIQIATSGATTFSHAITAAGLIVNGGGSRQYINSGHLRLSDDYNIEWGGGTNYIRGSNASNYVKIATNSSDALTIDSSQNSVFSGSVTAAGLTLNNVAGANKQFLNSGTTTTGANYININSTGGAYYLGAENSAGNELGASAYDFVMQAPSARAINLMVGAGRARLTSTGLDVTGSVTATSATLDDYVIHDGNTATKFGFPSANLINFTTNGTERLVLAGSYTVFNESGADVDFRVESVNSDRALFVQGSDGQVNITNSLMVGATTAPSAKLVVSGNSDISDEDCMLIIKDVDGSAGSRIPSIMFQGVGGNHGRIRGTNHSGLVFSGSSSLSSDFILDGSSAIFNNKLGVGITPVEVLDLKASSGDTRVRLDAASGSDTEIKFFNAGVAQYTIGHDDGTDNFVIGGANVDTPMVSVNKSGRLGIGVSPNYPIHVEKSVSGDWLGKFKNTHATNGYGLLIHAGDDASVSALSVGNYAGVGDYLVVKGDGNVGIGVSSVKASLDIKQTGNNWEDGILLQHDNANTGWNIHAERGNNSLWFGYNSDTSVALTSQNATAALKIDSSGIQVTGSVTATGGTLTGNLAFSQPSGLTFANGQNMRDNGSGGFKIHSGAMLALTHSTSTNLTSNGNTIWTAGNDGAGSGLDADTVDGVQASGFSRLNSNNTAGTHHNLNDGKLYFRTHNDNNHYLWNNASDWEELVAYTGTGFKITSSTGYNMMTLGGTGAVSMAGTLAVEGKADFQGTAAIEGGTSGSGYGLFKGYSANSNHFMASRGIVTGSTASPTISGGHQMTFVEYVANNADGFRFKSSNTGTYEEIAYINRAGINTIGAYKVNGTTVIDSSRNLTNIGTISSATAGTILDSSQNLTNINNIYASGYRIGSTTVIDANRRILAADGAQNVPYITFAADTDTGLYRPSADTIGFSTGGSEKMRLTSTGLGIGTASPAQLCEIKETSTSTGVHFPLTLGGSTHTAGYAVGIALDPEGYGDRNKIAIVAEGRNQGWSRGKLHFLLDAVSDSGQATLAESKMVIEDNGSVGIGTVEPSTLHPNANQLVVGSGSGGTGMTFYTGSGDAASIHFADGNSGDAEYRGQLIYAHNDDSFRFYTAATEKMRIFSDGDVSIGMTANYAKLNVNGDVRAENSRFLAGREDAANPAFAFHDDADTGMFNIASNILAFATSGSERLRIDSSGRVGIGVDPVKLLHAKAAADGSIFRLERNQVASWDFSIGNTSTLTGVGAGALELLPQTGNSYFAIGQAGTTNTLLHVKNTGIYVVNGLAATPAYSFVSDTNTGMYLATADTLAFATGGTERLRVDASGNVDIKTGALQIGTTTVIDASRNLTNIASATVTTLKETDGGDGFTEMGPQGASYGYHSWGHEFTNSGSGYCGLRFAGKKKYFVLEADVLGTNSANHQGMFWGNADGTATYGGSSTGYKTTHQNSTTFHIRTIANVNALSVNPGFDPNDGAWHHQKITATPDGYVRIWIDGVLKFEATGYIPSAAGYLGFINYIGTVRYANVSCRTLTAEDGITAGTISSGAITATADTDALTVFTTSNGTGADIRFSDQTSRAQSGYLRYVHSDTQSYGSGNAFLFNSTEATTTILADGKLMFKEGLYVKPSSGTGGGTLIVSSSGNLTNLGTIDTKTSQNLVLKRDGVTVINAVSGATYLSAGGSTAVSLTLQSGRTVAPILSIGSVNNFTDVIDASRNLTNIGTITSNGTQLNAHSTPIKYTYNGNTGTYNPTVTYINQNNTSGSTNNGMFIEMGRLTDSGSAEVRHFVVGARGGQINFKVDGSGNTTATGNITAYSDERLKENIQTLDGKKVLQMRGVSFTKDGEDGSGVIAQELEKIAPELVHDGEYKSVAYGNLVGYLIENAKEQQKEIDELKTLVKQLLEK